MGMGNLRKINIYPNTNILHKNEKAILKLTLKNINSKLSYLNNVFINFYYMNFKNAISKIKRIRFLKKKIKLLNNFYKKILSIYRLKYKNNCDNSNFEYYPKSFRKKNISIQI